MADTAGRDDSEASWKRARRHYLRLAKDPDSKHLASMQLVIEYAQARGFDRHFRAYTLPEFLAISTAQSPDQALVTPFLSVSVDSGGVFHLALVSPASSAPVASFRVPQALLFHELASSFSALSDLLVEQAEQGS